MTRARLAVLLLTVVALWPRLPAAQGSIVRLVDITKQAGLAFTHNNGAFGRKYLPETLGSGAAVIDVDNDGRQDLLLVNGASWPGQPKSNSRSRLFRNRGNAMFEDITASSGIGVEMYGMGAAVADYDNDGWQDILLTAVGQNRLFRNTGEEHVRRRHRQGRPGRA